MHVEVVAEIELEPDVIVYKLCFKYFWWLW